MFSFRVKFHNSWDKIIRWSVNDLKKKSFFSPEIRKPSNWSKWKVLMKQMKRNVIFVIGYFGMGKVSITLRCILKVIIMKTVGSLVYAGELKFCTLLWYLSKHNFGQML